MVASADLPPIVMLCFTIQDTGFGIDPAEQSLLFEPFVQAKAGVQSQEGTGLGLPISRQFIQLMGGELHVQSNLSEGATFYFTIPVQLGQPDSLPTLTLNHKVIGLAEHQPRFRLLVVEDNPENRQFLVYLLRSIGFEVQEAENGQQAITQWQTWQPDLIWMDMRMPIMDGYQATQQIRALEKAQSKGDVSNSPTRILALTASAFEDERAGILEAGCDDFVCKPVTETILFEKLAEHLQVEYQYALPPEPSALPQKSYSLSPTDLRDMPTDWIAQVHRAARIADEEVILNLLEKIPDQQTHLSTTLRQLVEQLRLDILIELTAPQE
jgi:CheY-like chemotaxis protein